MGGIASLFKNFGKKVDAEAQKKADQIASENAVDFGKQDLAELRSNVNKVKGNIGTIKGEIAVLKEKVDGFRAQIKKHDDDAIALETINPDLSRQHLEAAESLDGQVASLQAALDIQEKLLKEQQDTRRELESSLQQAETDLVTLKAMTDAASANEKLSKINSGDNALASFKQRNEEAKKRLIRSQTMKEESSTVSLDAETRKALGTAGASSRMARLKAAQQ